MNQEDSLITDTAYTESREIEHYTVGGIAINTFKFEEYPPKKSEMYLEYTDVDGEKNGAYQTKKIRIQDLGKEGKVTLLKEEKKIRSDSFFGNAPYDVMYVAAIVAVTASPLPLLRICLCRIF